MDDYIKRDDVIDLLEQVLNAEEFFDADNAKAQSDLALWFEERISELPKADVAEVVRCKDCGLCTYIQNIARLSCVHHGGIVLPDDYCSYGERRDNECK